MIYKYIKYNYRSLENNNMAMRLPQTSEQKYVFAKNNIGLKNYNFNMLLV